MGSAITYARRYGLQSACGIPSEDDDGNAASQAPKPAVSFLKPKGAIALLSSAESQKDLVAVWNSFPIDIKQNADVIELKDQLKTEFS